MICREIVEDDRIAVIELLTRGFAAQRTRPFWAKALQRLAERTPPSGLPRFGYVLESSGSLVGVLLVIAAEVPDGDSMRVRGNVSSWYVEAPFQPYGMLLERHALRQRAVTYVNVTPAPHTLRGLIAQGYRQYVSGRTVTVPILARGGQNCAVAPVDANLVPGGGLSAAEVKLLREHARWGCICLTSTVDGQRFPFVFARRRRYGVIPFAYLLYCRDIQDFAYQAHWLGKYLAKRGMLLVVVDANRPLEGVPGRYLDGYPEFFKGCEMPRVGDLAYTERAIFGV